MASSAPQWVNLVGASSIFRYVVGSLLVGGMAKGDWATTTLCLSLKSVVPFWSANTGCNNICGRSVQPSSSLISFADGKCSKLYYLKVQEDVINGPFIPLRGNFRYQTR